MADDLSTPHSGGTWICERDTVAACLSQPVMAAIDELGVIAVEGSDAANFLHSQLTNDVTGLDLNRVQLNGYCSPKGRLYAVFNQWRDADTIYLQLPREILPTVMKRLSMFVLRAKARLRDASPAWQAFALLGPGSTAALRAFAGNAPGEEGAVARADGTRLVRLSAAPQVAERHLMLVPAQAATATRAALAALKEVPSAVFWWTQLDAAIPNVFAATQEKFVPQMINLEVLGGVNFKKGCYPGQEVVARSQYLGKLRRRMQIGHTDAEARAGADIYADTAEPVGTVVMAASAPQGGMDLLFECPAERTAGPLHLHNSSGPALIVRPLPYALVDVTA